MECCAFSSSPLTPVSPPPLSLTVSCHIRMYVSSQVIPRTLPAAQLGNCRQDGREERNTKVKLIVTSSENPAPHSPPRPPAAYNCSSVARQLSRAKAHPCPPASPVNPSSAALFHLQRVGARRKWWCARPLGWEEWLPTRARSAPAMETAYRLTDTR